MELRNVLLIPEEDTKVCRGEHPDGQRHHVVVQRDVLVGWEGGPVIGQLTRYLRGKELSVRYVNVKPLRMSPPHLVQPGLHVDAVLM